MTWMTSCEDRDVINNVSCPAPRPSENKTVTNSKLKHYTAAWIYLYFVSETKNQLFEYEAHQENIVFYDNMIQSSYCFVSKKRDIFFSL